MVEKLILRAVFQGRPEYELFGAPKPGRNVWPHQGCPCFQERALDVGVCQYPRKTRI